MKFNKIDFITINFGKNPKRGGIPAKDQNDIKINIPDKNWVFKILKVELILKKFIFIINTNKIKK